MLYIFFFFFSSRRRHTRLQGDWSSDVCSSDLRLLKARQTIPAHVQRLRRFQAIPSCALALAEPVQQKEEEHRYQRIDERRDEEAHIEPRLRLRQKNSPRQGYQSLMSHEENRRQREARRRMLGIQPCSDR